MSWTSSRGGGSLRALAIFYGAFLGVWTAAVVAVWKLGLLPEGVRPWFRTAVWVGASGLWISWRRPAAPVAWVGVWPIALFQVAVTIAAFAIIFSWNVLRVHVFDPPADRLVEATGWSLVGVVVEELLFRGVIQTQLAERASGAVAVIVGAALFLLIHFPGWVILSIPVNALTVASVFAIGLMCGALRHWSQSLWPAVGAHWANNLGAML